MTYQEVSTMIEGIGVPFAYDHFSEENAADPPFSCFYFRGSNDFTADNTNYQKIRTLTLELYTDNKDFFLERTVETALNGAGLVFSRSEIYIDSERMYLVTFVADIIITED